MGIAVIATAALLMAGCSEPSVGHRRRAPEAKDATSEASVAHQRLRLMTYNILADPVFQKLRASSILKLLRQADADIVALQEVAPWFLEELLRDKWIRGRYHFTEHRDKPFAPGGQLVLSKLPISRVSWSVLPGPQRRTVLAVDIQLNGHTFRVATTHMESFLEDGPIRARQLDAIFSTLKAADDALFLGDLNFGDGEQPETAHLDQRFVDLWTALKEGQPGYTWNIPQNPLARVGSFRNERSRRLDRILLRSSRWKPSGIRLVGNRAVGRRRWFGRPLFETGNKEIDEAYRHGLKMRVFPSDHYGLVGEISWN